jgi:putative transcriptional regulator
MLVIRLVNRYNSKDTSWLSPNCAWRRFKMAFSYNKLWKLLIDKKMLKKDLMAKTNLTSTTLAKMGKDLPVSMDVLGRICKALDVNVGDIVDYIDDTSKK